MPKPLVIYHSGCWDGFCAAWLMHRYAFGGGADYHPVQYGEAPPDVTGREVYVLDFSYPRATLERMHESAGSLVVLDHHRTARADLEGLPYCTFDMGVSGAQLTWRMLRPVLFPEDEPTLLHEPWIVSYTADRDLWAWSLPDSKEINAAIRSFPLEFKVWDYLTGLDPTDLVPEGTAILRAEEITIQAHLARAREIEFDGYSVLSVNATSLFSEIAGRLAEDRPFGMVWFERPDQDGRLVRQYSLRSREGGIDVSEIAKAHGGGGHMRAAGFEEPLPR